MISIGDSDYRGFALHLITVVAKLNLDRCGESSNGRNKWKGTS